MPPASAISAAAAARSLRLASRLTPKSAPLPRGFELSAVSTGVKKNAALDLALIHSTQPCTAAASFTQNLFQAAPVRVSRTILDTTGGTGIRTVAVNSGCANACTGVEGDKDAQTMVDLACEAVGAPKGAGLVLSTGVIGQRLQMEKIKAGLVKAGKGLGNGDEGALKSAATAIMTTDTFPKYLSRALTLPESGVRFTLAGMCKGAGMIHPNMKVHDPTTASATRPLHATMLGVLMTDAPLTAPAATSALSHALGDSFNCISVDGDTSTNDTIVLLANGLAAPKTTTMSAADTATFATHLRTFARDLAAMIVWDGEGATKFVSVRVTAPTEPAARAIASSIATSPLVKTALYGQDANWGRILCAVGYASVPGGVALDAGAVSLKVRSNGGELKLVENGQPKYPIDEAVASKILAEEEIEIVVDMGMGSKAQANYYTCDFSDEYVHINADYRS
ncbi:glutamate N-acetyltransferase/amino-acid acetyltransferase [Allomyces macrogynus ATCC 38327]|uniref:Arginine biosynthesis bifunctional protein ArgJ, mitochondrial n=1 Tax=Allomyces macrogynus (strain ATCC 38327) TaxID=578462 RepID=A0A0L0SXI0_ALLM3|nr:glutamate N-acetyltransferase/amino-acid acetyltransferase [Allomyces macrogynus ATCC 38327]|eukprot:KNE67196.1 glutamate N-acetyltransferase/amino-acid acetyltransferase [Allomyces macrogynus ATCC 38327]